VGVDLGSCPVIGRPALWVGHNPVPDRLCTGSGCCVIVDAVLIVLYLVVVHGDLHHFILHLSPPHCIFIGATCQPS
jgi:hypothetical protein